MYCNSNLMFQRALNTSQYSLSPNLSFLLLPFDTLHHRSRYTVINLDNRFQDPRFNANLVEIFYYPRHVTAGELMGGRRIEKIIWITEQSLAVLLDNQIVYLVIITSTLFLQFLVPQASMKTIRDNTRLMPSKKLVIIMFCMQPDLGTNVSQSLVSTLDSSLINRQYSGEYISTPIKYFPLLIRCNDDWSTWSLGVS